MRKHSPNIYYTSVGSLGLQFIGSVQSPNQQVCFSTHTHTSKWLTVEVPKPWHLPQSRGER